MSNVVEVNHTHAQQDSEMLRPNYPRDVAHFEDGTWLCSSASLLKLTRSFQRFGFQLRPLCTFSEFHEKFSFILQASSLLEHLDKFEAGQSAEMLAYLRAVKSGDTLSIATALANVKVPKALPVNHSIPVSRPTLELTV